MAANTVHTQQPQSKQQNISTTAADISQKTVEEVHGQLFEVSPRYVNLSYIGEGAYGMVV
jgi:hypothetical protein